MCLIDDADACQVWRETMQKARKVYKCGECYRVIDAGERHNYIFMVYEGEPSTHRMCAHCRGAADLLVKECGGFLTGGVEEDLRGHSEWLHDYPWSRQAARYRVAMRRKWRRFDNRGLMPVPYAA